MKLDHKAFEELPHLREKILDPLTSRFRNIDLEEFDRQAILNGLGPDWRRPDADRERTRQEILGDRMDRDLWVFAYGSLMWDPAFFFDEVRLARAEGYERRFCLLLKSGRGSPDAPGLMAGLDRGDSCQGLAFRIRADHVDQESEIIWRREMIGFGYVPTFIPVETAIGSVEALTFVVDPDSDRYQGGLNPDEAAAMIAVAEGRLGSNREYLDSLSAQLDLLGLEDAHFSDLYARVQKCDPA